MSSWETNTAHSPSANPTGRDLGASELALHRHTPNGAASVIDSISLAWQLVRERPVETILYGLCIIGMWFGIYMITYMASYFIGLMGMLAMTALGEAGAVVGGIFLVVMLLVMMTINMGLMALASGAMVLGWLRLVRGQQMKFEHLFDVKRFAKPLLGAKLAIMLGTFAALVPIYGLQIAGVAMADGGDPLSSPLFLAGTGLSMVFSIGFMPIWLGLLFHVEAIVDKNLSGIEGIKASWALLKGHKLAMFGLVVLLYFINLAGMIPCGLGTIVTFPLSIGALVVYYDMIAEPGNAYLREGEGLQDVFA